VVNTQNSLMFLIIIMFWMSLKWKKRRKNKRDLSCMWIEKY